MKVGSKVVCIKEGWPEDFRGNKFPVKDEVYTIRDILSTTNGAFIRLEEIINPILFYFTEGNFECAFSIHHFRELSAFGNEVAERVEKEMREEKQKVRKLLEPALLD